MNYFLAPRSDEQSYKNATSSLLNGLTFDQIKDNLTPEGHSLLSQEELLFAWGNREGKKHEWHLMENGDTVLFYSKGNFVLQGEIFHKEHSRGLSLDIWPPDEKGNPWEYVFFLKDLREIFIPKNVLFELAEYKANYVIQGLTHLTPPRIEKISARYGTVDDFIKNFQLGLLQDTAAEGTKLKINLNADKTPKIHDNPYVRPKINMPETLNDKAPTKYKTDYLKRSKNNMYTGSLGEEIVLKYEKDRLRAAGKPGLCKEVIRVSLVDDSRGYDIMSCEVDGSKRYIEVKTSKTGAKDIRFHLSEQEYRQSKKLTNYYIYYVEKPESNEPIISIFKEPFISENSFSLTPESYIVAAER